MLETATPQTSPATGRSIQLSDPATGIPAGTVPVAGIDEVHTAVAVARDAQRAWAAAPAGERAAALHRWADALRPARDELAALVTAEMGKPIGDARGGVDAGIAAVVQYAELGPLHRGRRLHGDPGADDVMERHPRGVAAVLLPWNDPVALACAQVAACAVMGNAVVVKPSERAPLAVARAIALLPQELRQVVQLVHGDGGTGALLVDAELDLVLHTGSVQTGRSIAVRCADRMRKAVLELGGKDVLIVDAGVDPQWAAAQAAQGAFANAGQLCVSVERILVHEAIAAPFVEALTARARALRSGPGSDPATELGPLVDDRLRAVVHAHVRAAIDDGARLHCGGQLPDGPGSFYPATVLTGVTPAMRIWREETFGPVAPVTPVPSFDAAIALAGDTDFGLAATVLTVDERHARRAARELDVGTVKVNAVFGGAPGGAAEPRRGSGLGLGYGPELLDEVSAWKVVHREAGVPASRPTG